MLKNKNIENNFSIYLLSRPLFLGIGISKIIKIAGSSAWISIILGSIIGLIINYILTKLPNKSIKALEIISNFLLLTISMMVISKLIASIYLGQTPTYIIKIPIILLLVYTMIKGKKNFLKGTIILIIIHFFLYIFPIISLVPTIKIDNYLPLFTESFKNIITAAIAFAVYSTIPYISLDNFKERYNYKAYLFSCLTMFLIIMTTIGSIGCDLANIYRYPEYIIFKKISLLGFIENIENILFSIWFIDSYIICSHTCFKIKESSNIYGVLISLLIIFFLGTKLKLINYVYINFLINYSTYILGGIYLIYLLSKIKGLTKKD